MRRRHWGDTVLSRSSRLARIAFLSEVGPGRVKKTRQNKKSIPGELGKFLHHALIDRPLERHDQIGKILHRLPAPFDELGLVAAAGARGVDFVIVAREANCEPFLPLAALASLPGAPG